MCVDISCIKTQYMSNLYMNAGKTIMDTLFRKKCRCIDFASVSRYYSLIINASSGFRLAVEDSCFAFYDILCRKISEQLFCNEEVYLILSPYHDTEVIYHIIVHSKNIIIYNTFPFNICENSKLYNTLQNQTDTERLTYAIDFFNKSIIKQQE